MIDKLLQFSNAQDVGFAEGSAVSTYSVDLGLPGTVPGLGGSPLADLMRGNKPRIVAQMVEALDSSGGSGTLQVELIATTGADLTGSVRVLDTSLAIAEATAIAGYQFHVDLPTKITERYIGLRYTVGGETTTAGTISAWLELNPSDAVPLGG